MKQVLKFPIAVNDAHNHVSQLQLPRGSELLSVEATPSGPAIYALVNGGVIEQATRKITVVYTGKSVPEDVGTHMRTVVHKMGVFHVFVGEEVSVVGVAESSGETQDSENSKAA